MNPFSERKTGFFFQSVLWQKIDTFKKVPLTKVVSLLLEIYEKYQFAGSKILCSLKYIKFYVQIYFNFSFLILPNNGQFNANSIRLYGIKV